MTGTRACLIPDLDADLIAALIRLNEILLDLAEADPVEHGVPAPLAGGDALGAFERIWHVLRPTQQRGGRLLAPDGKYEHLPLTVVQLDTADLALLGETAQLLGQLAATHNEVVTDTLTSYISDYRSRETPADVVAEVARIHGLLDLAPTDDTELLCQRLAGADPAGDIVLSPAEEQAYRRTAERLNGMWALGSGIDQFLY